MSLYLDPRHCIHCGTDLPANTSVSIEYGNFKASNVPLCAKCSACANEDYVVLARIIGTLIGAQEAAKFHPDGTVLNVGPKGGE